MFKDWTIEEGDKRVGTRKEREHKMAASCLSVLHVAPFFMVNNDETVIFVRWNWSWHMGLLT